MTVLTKPLKRVVNARLPHGVGPKLVVELQPNGQVWVREYRRRSGARMIDLAALYVRAIVTSGLNGGGR